MSAQLETRPPGQQPGAAPSTAPPDTAAGAEDRRETLLLVPTLLLLSAACLPLGRAFVGWAWLRPVLGAVLLSVGLSWTVRRLGGGPLLSLAVSMLGWAAFVTVAFLSHTALLGVVPTAETLPAGTQLWVRGIELVRERPAPTFAEPGLLLLTITGVWAVAHAVDGLVLRLQAPVKALLLSLALWLVPLVITTGHPAVPWTVPWLVAAALLLFASSATELGRWGAWGGPRHERLAARVLAPLAPSGALITGAAIVAGVALAATLPGYGEPPWYEVGGAGGTTVTTNPIVTIKPSLTAPDRGPVMEISTPRPVYLRTTSLDVYSEDGEWTNEGIRGGPVTQGSLLRDPYTSTAAGGTLNVVVEVVHLPAAVLVPAPYRPRAVQGSVAGGFQYDQRLATLTTSRDATLQPGDRYQVSSQLPDPDPQALHSGGAADRPADTHLPANVPAEVGELARRIVDDAGASTPLERALALQDEFQSGRWTYSLEPPQGHSPDAMLAFLESRVGYCEQYAGTMAVMLRSLGIPARVAVGFTPGEPRDDTTYVVSDANAHAWVEVLFGDNGWVAFEPTPRADGNVLTPSADNLAPDMTVAERAVAEPVEDPGPKTPEPDEQSPAEATPETAQPEAPDPQGGAAEPAGRGAGIWRLVTLAAALLALGAGVATVRRRRHATSLRTPSERVLVARDRVARVGRGLGLPAAPWETDHEYLLRLANRTAAVGAVATRTDRVAAEGAAATLADHVAAVRYAPDLPPSAAQESEAAASTLHAGLLAGRSTPRRALVECRGAIASVAGARSLSQRETSAAARRA